MKRLRLSLFVALLLGLIVWGCGRSSEVQAGAPAPAVRTAANAAAVHQQLRRAGNWLVDGDGRVVIVHGVNAVWKRAPYVAPDSVNGFTAADADWLAANGFDAVRLGVLFAGVMPQPHMVDSAYLDQVDRIVQLLAARGIYVLLDFHQDLFSERYQGEGFPDWATQPSRFDSTARLGFPLNYFTPPVSQAFDRLWDDSAGLQDDYRDAWAAVATRFGAQDHLMGYELINEPWPGSAWPGCVAPQGCAGFENDRLQPMYERALAGIRAADPDNLVWVEPQILFDFGVASHLGERAINDPQLGFSWHDYCLTEALLQTFGLKQLPACSPLEQRVYRHARETSRRLGSASLMTEFGASDDTLDIDRVVGYADDNLVGWMYWSYKNWGDPTTQAQSTGAQSMFANDANLGSVKLAKLKVLERPYPQAVAGTPLDFGYDTAANAFTLTYSTAMLDGSSAPDGLLTDIFVPALQFPQGYAASVEGGHAVSAANAPHLLVAANPGAVLVTVKIVAALH
ncbi:MAG: cellulase family glycosylhydrolase [Nevskia sp.]|nr:cellulase family glycosylhydrolase [Nevskia sp.]